MEINSAFFGKVTSRKCNSVPTDEICKTENCKCMLSISSGITCRHGTCKCSNRKPCTVKCLCANALLKKKILSAKDIFDELGNYNYCYSVLSKITDWRRMSVTRNILNERIAAINPPDYRYATANTILKHRLQDYVCGTLPGITEKVCVNVVLTNMIKDNDLSLIHI